MWDGEYSWQSDNLRHSKASWKYYGIDDDIPPEMHGRMVNPSMEYDHTLDTFTRLEDDAPGRYATW
jgi:hypothetical protein